MAITDRQVAALRARLKNDTETLDRLWEQLGAIDLMAYVLLELAALRLTLLPRCPRGGTYGEVIELVGEVRGRSRWRMENIDPLAAERLVRHVLTHDLPNMHDEDATSRVAWYLLHVLVTDAGLDDAGLDDLLDRARELADAWMSGPPPRKKRIRWPWRR